MSTTNQPYGFLVGYDLEKYPEGAHKDIITAIENKYKDYALRILDTTWIIKADSTKSKDLYDKIALIIEKIIGKNIYYLSIWKIEFPNFWEKLRKGNRDWIKKAFGVKYVGDK